MKTAVHPSGSILTFDKDNHKYTVDNRQLTSVTTIIKELFPKFDGEKIANKKAARDKVSPESLLAAWEQTRNDASAFGNMIHNMAELIILSRDLGSADHLPQSDRERSFLEALKLSIVKISKNFDFVEEEKIVFSPSRNLAGTIDLLLRSKATGSYVIADWKSSKEIKRFAFGRQTGLGICKHLPNCNYIHYSLQLALYKELMLSEGYLKAGTNVSGAIIHLFDDGPTASFAQIAPRDLSYEAKKILGLK